MNLAKRLADAMLDLVYPRRAVCMGCGSMLGLDRDDLCESCCRKLAQSWIGPKSPGAKLRLDGAAYAHVYAGPAGGMVRNLKYRSVWVLAEPMGAEIARAAEMLRIPAPYLVTCVPMHPKRLRRRGKNHAKLLARCAARRLGVEYRDLLVRTRNAPQQARLEARERRRNLNGGFAASPEGLELLPGATVLLVDDVCTTGATAQNCALALRAAGARRVFFASYALGTGREK